ncbi:hypothetical protein TsFJ059_006850 [Trichoderma semiorbis]|uniref:Uncharacterized protein n=1 Tax=Trichoderma semiorbis TaxID=1491008 RepID=A0A9P8HDV5_9HYPO|nr:hypothetical protein TsFJ059_006850 [Trichoderma semiorbis]
MHRAVLMMSMPGDNDQDRGLDTKVIAIQAYTFALQELSRNFEEAKKTQDILIATLILMAYFECFAGAQLDTFHGTPASKQNSLNTTSIDMR